MKLIDQIKKQQAVAERRISKSEPDLLLEAEQRDIELWKRHQKHTKNWLVKFLEHNIAEVFYFPPGSPTKKSMLCTMSKPLIEAYQKLEQPREKPEGRPNVKTEKPLRVYCLETADYETINLKGWRIGRFVTLITENVELLNAILASCRRK